MFYLIGFLLLNLWIYILKNVKYNKEIALLNVTLLENRPSFRPMRNSFSGCIRLGVFLLLFFSFDRVLGGTSVYWKYKAEVHTLFY